MDPGHVGQLHSLLLERTGSGTELDYIQLGPGCVHSKWLQNDT